MLSDVCYNLDCFKDYALLGGLLSGRAFSFLYRDDFYRLGGLLGGFNLHGVSPLPSPDIIYYKAFA